MILNLKMEQEAQAQAQIGMGPLRDAFHQLQMELRASRLGKRVSDFSGESPKKFREWISDIERVGRALNADDNTMKALCLESVKGTAAEFFSRITTANPQATWREIRNLLHEQYSDTNDTHLATQRLRRVRQKRGETVQSFAERIRILANDAYPNQDIAHPFVQNALIETLIEGVLDDAVAKRLIRHTPDTFQGAVTLAVQEQQAARHFELRRGTDEPMDVSMSSQKMDKVDMLCDKLDNIFNPRLNVNKPSLEDKLDMLVGKVDEMEERVNRNQTTIAKRPSNAFYKTTGRSQAPNDSKVAQDMRRWTTDGRPICL